MILPCVPNYLILRELDGLSQPAENLGTQCIDIGFL
jgi:hypothetical protein